MKVSKKIGPDETLQSDFSQEVYVGANAIREFIAPENHAPLPLVELPESVNPYRKDGVRIMAKLMTFLPGGQVKSGTAYEMLKTMESAGELKGIHTFFEASSGNTVGMEAMLTPHFGEKGEKKVIAYVVPGTVEGKIKLLQVLGAQVVFTTNGINKAKDEGRKESAVNPSQYDNPSNPNFFYKIIGPQLWNQTKGKIGLLCAGLGSGGTMIGINNYLKQRNADIQTIGVIVKEGDSVPGVRTRSRLNEVSLPWEKAVDRKQIVSAYDSYKQSLALIRKAALPVGPSTGFALQGLLQELEQMKQDGSLDTLRNKSGEIIAVFVAPDGPFTYINDYFTYLDPSLFKPVQEQ